MHDNYFLGLLPFLTPGVNSTEDCPDCGKRSLSVMLKDGTFLYHCWRAGCGIAGRVVTRPGGVVSAAELHEKLNPYTAPILPLQSNDIDRLNSDFNLTEATIKQNIWHDGSKFVLPVWTPTGACRGHVLRLPWGATGYPKSVIYKQKEGALLSWYRGPDTKAFPLGDTLAIVEDQISAMRVAQDLPGYEAVALLGTALNAEKVAEIQKEHSHVVIALDADATRLSFQHARRWGKAFDSFRVVVISKDIKDMKPEELAELPF